jgi:anti-sigma factor RsiW
VTCKDARELVEAIAAGDLDVDDALRAHFESCPVCAAALASARRIEAALKARETPKAPAAFTSTVVARIRHERWKSEQHVDRVFNIAIAVAVLLVLGGVLALTNVSGVIAGAGMMWGLLGAVSGQVVAAAAPAILTYVAAAGLLVSALVMWWWAERRLSL